MRLREHEVQLAEFGASSMSTYLNMATSSQEKDYMAMVDSLLAENKQLEEPVSMSDRLGMTR